MLQRLRRHGRKPRSFRAPCDADPVRHSKPRRLQEPQLGYLRHLWRGAHTSFLAPPAEGTHAADLSVAHQAKIEDLSAQAQSQAAEQFARRPEPEQIDNKASAAPADDDDEEVDETGVEPKDIELVMTQANVSRSKAVKALKTADGDIVSAIMVGPNWLILVCSRPICNGGRSYHKSEARADTHTHFNFLSAGANNVGGRPSTE